MSMDPLAAPACADGPQPAGTMPGGPDADIVAENIRRQATVIIEAVLSRTTPEEAAVRDQLREHLAANPGHPEVALAEHLMSLGSLDTFTASVQDMRLPEAQPDWTNEYETTAPDAAESA